MGHDVDIDHEHEERAADQAAMAELIWRQQTLQLRTVGIDIGSSTSHLMFARVTLQRPAHAFSSRFTVVAREVLWRSPIRLTPFLPDGSIDAHALGHGIADAYRAAGLRRSDVDSGAVILTGEAIKRSNAAAINHLFAGESGKFVCATAGHQMECMLAARGSGATDISKRRGQCGLHVDIGGGTTKLALIQHGEIVSVAAFVVGGRLLARGGDGAWSRIDDSARQVAQSLGLEPSPATFAQAEARQALCQRLAQILVDRIVGVPPDALGRALELTPPLERKFAPAYVTFSGGVSEYLFGHEKGDYGDIAAPLADAIAQRLKPLRLKVIEPFERIRATVIGASQFTVQVSGQTIYLPDPEMLPVRNVPVLDLALALTEEVLSPDIAAAFANSARMQDLEPAATLALSFAWREEPEYRRLLCMAQGILQFAAPAGRREQPLFLMIDGDVGASLGRILREELGLQGPLACIDGIELRPFDFVDVGEKADPPGVVPLVIKSLLVGGR
ncbi:MAG: ethanolamine ammonia-lyase reactivating factor EutA [Burkholderiaceae bacterium]|jgi:ethanolamine utilization protein EutA|nr:ethanolamine ammonia-lyase reactivating factor EutA [Burkholderiaceae bacterium]